MTTTLIGAAPGKVTNYPEFELGQVANIEAAEYIYIKAAQTFISSHSAILIDFNNTGHLLTADNALLNSRVGVAGETPLKGQYLWVQVRGDSRVLVAAGVTARSGLYPGDNSGVLTNTSGDNYVSGMATVADNGLVVAAVRCRLNNPRVELTPGTSTSTSGITATAARALIADWAETGNTSAIPANKLTNAPSGGVSTPTAVDLTYTLVGTWTAQLGANQGGFSLYDSGVSLPSATDLHNLVATNLTNGDKGTFQVRLSDLDTTAINASVWASGDGGTTRTATNARKYALGQNRSVVVGKESNGNYIFGFQDHTISVKVEVWKITVMV